MSSFTITWQVFWIILLSVARSFSIKSLFRLFCFCRLPGHHLRPAVKLHHEAHPLPHLRPPAGDEDLAREGGHHHQADAGQPPAELGPPGLRRPAQGIQTHPGLPAQLHTTGSGQMECPSTRYSQYCGKGEQVKDLIFMWNFEYFNAIKLLWKSWSIVSQEGHTSYIEWNFKTHKKNILFQDLFRFFRTFVFITFWNTSKPRDKFVSWN